MPERRTRSIRRLLRAAAQRVRSPAPTAVSAPGLEGRLRERPLHPRPERLRPLRRSREQLLIDAQRLVFKEIHRRFVERTRAGQQGLGPALLALDALWQAVRALHDGAPFLVETLAMAGHGGPTAEKMVRFYAECTELLEDGIRRVFEGDLDQLTVPPERMAVLIRIFLSGLLVELAQARTPAELATVEQAYADLRELFQRFALSSVGAEPAPAEEAEHDAVPLPW